MLDNSGDIPKLIMICIWKNIESIETKTENIYNPKPQEHPPFVEKVEPKKVLDIDQILK